MPHLLATRRFLPLFITQFLGAFNDNVFKNSLVILITYKASGDLAASAQMLVTLAAALFILPYLLFSATAGQFADKMDRAKLARYVKLVEIILMLIASAGFLTGSMYFLLFVLFFLGIQATFFGPIKYALLPQHLHDDELIAGNSYIEAGTFLAILIGTLTGGLLILQPAGTEMISAAIILFALGGYLASRHIPQAPAPEPELHVRWNIAAETWKIIQYDCKNRRVFLSILGISWFWLVGATFLSQFPTYAKDVLHADQTVVTLFLTVFSVGIGIGSFLCNVLLKGQINSRYVPWAAAGITVFTIDLFFASHLTLYGVGVWIGAAEFMRQPAHWRILFDMLMIAVSGGLYVVPLYAIMQHDSDPTHRARTIATNNILNALFMVVASLVTMGLFAAKLSVSEVFLTLAIANIPIVFYSRRLSTS